MQSVTGVTATNYIYDANGNAITDGRNNKTISYNYLNLPQTVSGGLSYTYDATGQKLTKNNNGTLRHYLQGIEYQGSTIDIIQTEEGIARHNGNNAYSYEYNLTDHLGNVRVSFYKNPSTNNLDILQRDDYYAFGKRKVVQGGTNKYLYNGKELQEELGEQYDYGARFYDPVIGRWNVVDPLAEKAFSWTPYRYAFDNPLRYIDIDGLIEWPIKGNTAVNKGSVPNGGFGLKNTIVRTSTYLDTNRPPGGSNPHVGIDYRSSVGTEFYSLGNGVVSAIGETKKGARYITVEYGNGDKIRFLHIQMLDGSLEVGSKVFEGQPLGLTGKSGTEFEHLHVDGVNKDGQQINPENQNYGTVSNEEFFNKYGGDYTKLPGFPTQSSVPIPTSESEPIKRDNTKVELPILEPKKKEDL
ncbi:RHS repeat-associated core domain-containing protein [Pedobacter glucosidilyticus]|uniref:RHS repeat-associated core domain-containing protein n=1 Tax=Pedobacter glucosidilyticus TaxID=1122941 RepID=UPI0004219BCA|nr:RHS repeat-associated core domain-containing protein [Pedobacter glucosidilyticus]